MWTVCNWVAAPGPIFIDIADGNAPTKLLGCLVEDGDDLVDFGGVV